MKIIYISLLTLLTVSCGSFNKASIPDTITVAGETEHKVSLESEILDSAIQYCEEIKIASLNSGDSREVAEGKKLKCLEDLSGSFDFDFSSINNNNNNN